MVLPATVAVAPTTAFAWFGVPAETTNRWAAACNWAGLKPETDTTVGVCRGDAMIRWARNVSEIHY